MGLGKIVICEDDDDGNHGETVFTMELDSVLKGIKDLTDPACMERLLMYEEKIQNRSQRYMELLIQRLHGETVSWSQPWYQQGTGLTRNIPNDSEKPFKTTHFTKAESHLIKQNWKEFIKTYKLPNKPECLARWKNRTSCRNTTSKEEQVRNFVTAYLARGLQRNLIQVYKHFRTNFGAPVKGAYSETEEKIMEICFSYRGVSAVSMLTAILGREPRGIYKRLHLLCGGDIEKNEKKGRLKWTLPLATKLVKSLIEHSGLRFKKLKNANIPLNVWQKVGEDMDRPGHYVQRFWYLYLHTQLFVKFDVKLHRLRKKILKRLLKLPYEVWGDIEWTDVANQLPDGFTHRFVYHTVKNLIIKYPGNYKKEPLEKLVTYLLNCLKQRTEKVKNRRLKTLKLNEEKELEIVMYEEELPL